VKPVVVRRETFVTIPADVVWQLVEPASALAVWLPFANRARLASGEGLGRVQRVSTTGGRAAGEIDYEVVEYRPPTLLRWRRIGAHAGTAPASGPTPDLTLTIQLESTGPGTRVVLEARLTSPRVLGRIGLRLVEARRMSKVFARGLARLAAAGG
jgi:Polyketide cyclase / dehydrase and lipid transport